MNPIDPLPYSPARPTRATDPAATPMPFLPRRSVALPFLDVSLAAGSHDLLVLNVHPDLTDNPPSLEDFPGFSLDIP